MKVFVKFAFSAEVDGVTKLLMPGDSIDSEKLDPKLFAGMKERGFLFEKKLNLAPKSEIPHGAVEVKFEKPADVVVAQPEEKKEEAPKVEEPKPVAEQPTRKSKGNKNS